MTHISWIIGCLTIPGAVLRAFLEHLMLKLCRVHVEDPAYLQRNELFGHVEHKPVRTFAKSFCICFFPGFLMCLLGCAMILPAVLQLFVVGVTPHSIVTGKVSVMFIVCAALLYFGVSLLCHAFPTYEDALYLWENRHGTNVAARILLFVPIACMRAGAFLGRFGVWTLVGTALFTVSILFGTGVL